MTFLELALDSLLPLSDGLFVLLLVMGAIALLIVKAIERMD